MPQVKLETNEKISARFFELVQNLAQELEAEKDYDGLEVLPTVMLTTSLMALCRSKGADTVSALLEALKIKVENGDFTGPGGLVEDR